MADCVFPMVFPDYLIAVPRPSISIDLPDFLPFDDVVEDFLDDKTTKLPELGHAGVLFIGDRGSTGVTKYYEYGRYRSDMGEARRRPVPNCVFNSGKPEIESLKSVFQQISLVSGQRGRISSVYIEVPGQYFNMLEYARKRVQQNRDSSRAPYDIMKNSCVHFAMGVVAAAGVTYESSVMDARPISYINSLQETYPAAQYGSGQLQIDGF